MNSNFVGRFKIGTVVQEQLVTEDPDQHNTSHMELNRTTDMVSGSIIGQVKLQIRIKAHVSSHSI